MIKVSKETTKRLLDVHGWSAVLLGLALYVVVLTGSVVVFAPEIGRWSVSGHAMDGALAGKIDAKITELSKNVNPAYLEDVSVWQNSAGYIIAFFHQHVKSAKGMEEKGTRFVLDPSTMQVVSEEEGLHDEMPAVKSGYLEHFFADLHIKLHAPDPIGLYLTGILGLVLLVLAVSGFILHRHLIMDIFLSPRLTTRLLNTRDRHNLAGTWSIAFSFILAFTGAFFSFATSLGLPVMALTAFEGDREKAMVAVFGLPDKEDTTPSNFIGLEAIIDRAKQNDIGGGLPRFIAISHMGRADAKVITFHNPDDKTVFFKSYQFDGVTGEYLGEKPRVGKQPSLGNNLMSLMAVLHFGWFAGLLSRIIWLSLGLATCYVTLTGLQLWVQRREANQGWQRLGYLLSIIGYGTPIAMSAAAIGFLLSYARYPEMVESWTVNGFFIGVYASFVVGLIIPNANIRDKAFKGVLGLLLLSLPFVRYLSSEKGWLGTLADQALTVASLDITFIVVGILLGLMSLGWKQKNHFSKATNKAIIEAEA